MKEADLISVIMPAYNAEEFIEQAIQSVLIQEVNWELISIDDASIDQTEYIVQKYCTDDRIIYLKNIDNLGVAKTRNIGIEKCNIHSSCFLNSHISCFCNTQIINIF